MAAARLISALTALLVVAASQALAADAATPVPAPAPVVVTASADDDVPPVLIPWPLGGEVKTPDVKRPATPPGDDDLGPSTPLIPPVGDDAAQVAAKPAGPGGTDILPSLEPAPEAPRTAPPAAPGAAAPAGQAPGAAAPRAPGAPAAPRPPAEQRPPGAQPPQGQVAGGGGAGTKETSAGPQPGMLTEQEMDLLVPTFQTPTVDAQVAVTGLTPPTDDVRRWQFEDVGGLTWESEEASQEGDSIVLRGKVDIRSGIERIRADEVRLNTVTRKLEADGNVVLDRMDSRLTGRRLEYDTTTNTGVMYDAMGWTGDEMSFTSDVAEKIADDKYLLRGGTFTSCTQPAPIWQVKATKAIIHIDKFVYLWNSRVFFGKVPLAYAPWAALPIKQDRATGFMIPRISSSSTRGTSVSEEFFWAINRSFDVTVGGTYWSTYGFRVDGQARWFLPGMDDYGYLEGIYLHANEGEGDPQLQPERYLIDWEHRQRLGEWDLTFAGEIATDPLVDEFEGYLGNDTGTGAVVSRSPILNQRLTLQRRWGKHSLNIFFENDERGSTVNPPMPPALTGSPPIHETPDLKVEGTRIEINRSMPLAEWRASGLQLGGKKWASLNLQGSLASLVRGQEERYEWPMDNPTTGQLELLRFDQMLKDHQYQRADLYPQFSFPLGAGFLRVIPEVNLRATWWSRVESDFVPATPLQLETRPEVVTLPAPYDASSFIAQFQDGVDESTTMTAWDAGVRIEGPDFERIYNGDAEPGKKKWQHLVEPAIEWAYAPELDNVWLINGDQIRSHYQSRFPTREGTTQQLLDGGTNEVRFRLVNTLRSKAVVPPGSTQPQAKDIVIWTLSSSWDLDHLDQAAKFYENVVHDEDKDCNGDGDTDDLGEGGGARCPGGWERIETSRFANISSDVNIRATDRIHFSLRNTYDVLSDDLTSTSLTGSVDGDWGYVDVTYSNSRDRQRGKATSQDVSLTGEQWLYKGGRLRLGYDVTRQIDPLPVREYDNSTNPPTPLPLDSKWIYKRFVLSYFNQCVGLSLSWEDNASRSIQREKEWTFVVSLKDVGNFLRYRKRSTVQ